MALASPTKVSDLWYNDGNIVFQAESSVFRISLGLLAAHSPIFDAIRKSPQSQDQEMYEDCPLMLLDDKAEDLANFLRAVYDSGFFEPPPSRTTMDIVDGILRLSTKYEVPFLRKRALRHLDLPMCLRDFDALKRRRKIPITNPSAVQTADLVHEMDLPWSLPMVLYTCTLSIEGVVTSYMHRGERRLMNRSLQVLCIKAVEPLLHWYWKHILGFLFWTNVDGCKSSVQCNLGCFKLLKKYSFDALYNPLGSFSFVFEETVQKSVCTTCCTKSRDAHLAAREELWEALPELFHLPSWETLRMLKEQALTNSDASSEIRPINPLPRRSLTTTTRPERMVLKDESELLLSPFH